MKRVLFLVITILFSVSYSKSQEVTYVKDKRYEGYIFSKEDSLLSIPPEENRYTPNLTDIAMAEKILRDSLKSNMKFPIGKRMLKKYTRQYIGYLTHDNEIVIRINLFNRKKLEEGQSPTTDIIPLLGYCCIQINITTSRISEWEQLE